MIHDFNVMATHWYYRAVDDVAAALAASAVPAHEVDHKDPAGVAQSTASLRDILLLLRNPEPQTRLDGLIALRNCPLADESLLGQLLVMAMDDPQRRVRGLAWWGVAHYSRELVPRKALTLAVARIVTDRLKVTADDETAMRIAASWIDLVNTIVDGEEQAARRRIFRESHPELGG